MKRETELEILRLIHQNYSSWAIKKYFKDQNVTIHDCQMVRIKKKFSINKENQPPQPEPPKKKGPPFKLSPLQVSNLKKSVFVENPKPNYQLARKYDCP